MKKERLRFFNRFVALLVVFVTATLFLVACNPLPVGYDTYFNNFSSTEGYSKAEATLKLADFEQFNGRKVYFSGYDEESGIYIISEDFKFGGKEYKINGFCTEDEVLIDTRYISILDICGDYAIVTRFLAQGQSASLKIGLVKIRGENKGKEYGFSYTYGVAVTQYSFLNDKYLIMLGDKDYQDAASGGNSFVYATVYDYVSSEGKSLLEVGKVFNVVNTTKFMLYGDNLISTNYNIYRFHNIKNIADNGVFEMTGSHVPYNTADGYTASYVSCDAYYLGSNWFVLSSVYSSTTQYDSYEITKYDSESKTTTYVTIRSVRYNAVSGKAYDTDRVVLVANQYNDSFVRQLANAVNSQEEYYEDGTEDVKGYYFQPVVPTSSAVKDGYSIVYYYYFYYILGRKFWATTFSVYDQNADVVNIKELYMPLVFVDGIGLQNGDPNFSLPARDAEYFTYNKTNAKLGELTDKLGYDCAVVHDGVILTYDFELPSTASVMGAYDKSGNLILPFRYYELTPFFNGYATGSVIDNTDPKKPVRKFYRLSKTGAETELDDVYYLKNGVYITKSGTKYGLKSNDGTVLIPNVSDNISVIDNYLLDGKYIKTVVTSTENGLGVIYKLS